MRVLVALVAVTAALGTATASQAVIGGDADAGAHPSVGLLLVPSDDGLVPECSGVLVAPTVFLTAALPASRADAALADAGGAPISVGYGYSQRQRPQGFVYDGVRHAAAIPVVSAAPALLRLLDPDGAALCFGDSGGPQFLAGKNTIVSVTRGGSPSCHGATSATRLDTPSARGFLGRYLRLP
jgi:hypothetical protein